MKKNQILIAFLAIILLGSCATHRGTISVTSFEKGANPKYVDLAVGTAKTTKVLFIGGLKPDALVFEAKRNLQLCHPLNKGEVYANMSVDLKRSFFILFSTAKLTITSDVVCLDCDTMKNVYSAQYLKRIGNNKKLEYNIYKLNQPAMYLSGKQYAECTIIALNQTDAVIQYADENGALKTKKMAYSSLFVYENNKFKNKVGEIIDFYTWSSSQKIKTVGIIVAFGFHRVLIKNNIDLYKVEYENVELK